MPASVDGISKAGTDEAFLTQAPRLVQCKQDHIIDSPKIAPDMLQVRCNWFVPNVFVK